MDALADRVIGKKRSSQAKEKRLAKEALEAGRSPPKPKTDKEHFDAAFLAALCELRETNRIVALLEHDAIGELKSNIGRNLALRSPRRPAVRKKRVPLDLSGITIITKVPERDFVEVRDRVMNTYGFVRIGRKVVCSRYDVKPSREVKKVARNYFAVTPKPEQPRVVKPKVLRVEKPKFPKVVHKAKEIIVLIDEHHAGKYGVGKRFPVLVTWLKDESAVEAGDVPEELRKLSQKFVRMHFTDHTTHQRQMFRFRL